MCLTASWLSEDQDGPVLIDEPQGGEVLDEFAVDRGLDLLVELVDGAPVWKPGTAQACRKAPVAISGGLGGDKAGEELDV